MSQKTIIVDTKSKSAEIDALDYLVTIDIEHHKVHEMKHYTVSDVDSDVDAASPKYWHLKTSNNTLIHLTFMVALSKNGLFEVFQNPTITDDGTELDIINSNLNSENETEAQFYYDPTVTDDGDRIFARVIGDDSTSTPNVNGDMLDRQNEFVLRRNRSYIFKATAKNNDTRVSITLRIYEQ